SARELRLNPLKDLGVHGHHVFVMAVDGAILDHPDLAIALDNLRFDLADFLMHQVAPIFFPWMMASRASLTQSGQSESVWRGHPSVGLVFSQDLRSGLSDHFGVKDGFGLYLLKN